MRFLFVSLTILILTACGGSADDNDPEAELREWVARGELAVEEKDRSELLDMISAAYADSRGNDRDGLGDILRVYFFRQESIALLTTIDEITFYDDSAALVNMTIGMAGMNNGAFGFRADAYRFEFELHKEDDEWMLIGARWGELGSELH